MSARIPSILVLLRVLASELLPHRCILGVCRVEFGLEFRRVAAGVALLDLAIVGQNFLFVFLDVLQGGLDLFDLKLPFLGQLLKGNSRLRLGQDIIDRDAAAFDLRPPSAIDDSCAHSNPPSSSSKY